MSSPANSENITSAGLVKFDGTNAFTGVTVTQYDVLVGAASNSITSVGPGQAGQVLQSSGASNPPAYSTPTYPSVGGTNRQLLVSNGTNNVYTTETWATPGTSGNVLTSDGVNWTSAAAPGGGLLTTSGTLTNFQIKHLHNTPVVVISAPAGATSLINVLQVIMRLNYGGTSAFTTGAAQTIQMSYNSALSSNYSPSLFTTSDITSTVNTTRIVLTTSDNIVYATNANQPLTFYNPQTTEIGGNAANDNTISYEILYYITTI